MLLLIRKKKGRGLQEHRIWEHRHLYILTLNVYIIDDLTIREGKSVVNEILKYGRKMFRHETELE